MKLLKNSVFNTEEGKLFDSHYKAPFYGYMTGRGFYGCYTVLIKLI